MTQAFQIATGPMYSAEKPTRCRPYRQFIKRFRCLVCRQKWGIDPCHTGPHAYGQQGDDFTCIPLCRKCHRAFDAAPAVFAKKHHLDIPVLILRFIALWTATQRRTAR